MTPLNGAEALAQGLEDAGVTHVFGLPGTQNAPLYSALTRTGIKTILAGSELMAAFMANGFSRTGGGVPVVATIPGPGFTFALTGFAEAAHDSASMVLVTGAPATLPDRRFELQAIDQSSMVGPLAKSVLRLDDPMDAAVVAGHAVRAATERGPGPVLLEVSRGVLGAALPDTPPRATRPPEPGIEPAEACREIAAELAAARKVVVMAGLGAAGAAAGLSALVDRRPAMVMTTVSARGVLPESHPWSLAYDFLACSVATTNELLDEADLVLVLGCRTSQNGTGGYTLALPEDRTAHIDLDPEVLGANYSPRWRVLGDVGRAIEEIVEALPESDVASEWTVDDVARWRSRLRHENQPNPTEPRFPGVDRGEAKEFFEALQAALPEEAVVVTDTGQHQIMTREHLLVESPRGLLVPSDFQSMGFGLPAAIGAALAAPPRRTVAVIGDGSLMMCGLELATAVREGLDLTVIVFRDGYLGQIRAQQIESGAGEAAVALAPLDLGALAAATGASHVVVEEDAALTLREACRRDGVVLVEVPLADSPLLQRKRWMGTARGTVRRKVGRRGIRAIRRILGRD